MELCLELYVPWPVSSCALYQRYIWPYLPGPFHLLLQQHLSNIQHTNMILESKIQLKNMILESKIQLTNMILESNICNAIYKIQMILFLSFIEINLKTKYRWYSVYSMYNAWILVYRCIKTEDISITELRVFWDVPVSKLFFLFYYYYNQNVDENEIN